MFGPSGVLPMVLPFTQFYPGFTQLPRVKLGKTVPRFYPPTLDDDNNDDDDDYYYYYSKLLGCLINGKGKLFKVAFSIRHKAEPCTGSTVSTRLVTSASLSYFC